MTVNNFLFGTTVAMDTQVMLTEYQKAQDSAQYTDSEIWSSTNITWAAMLVLLGLVLGNITELLYRPLITVVSVLGLVLVGFQWDVQRLSRSITHQKYARCKEIEKALGMTQHLNLRYPRGRQTVWYRIVCTLFVVAWVVILYMVWHG
jgi:hypothetical protein